MLKTLRNLRKLLLLSAILLCLSPLAIAQQVTVTGTITDSNNTPYALGSMTVTLVNTTGFQPTFGGSPVFQTSYSLTLDSTGSFSISLPPNSTASPAIQPSGTQWNFNYQAIGGYGPANANVTITGAGSISASLSGLARISFPSTINPEPPCGPGQYVSMSISTAVEACGNSSAQTTVTIGSATSISATSLCSTVNCPAGTYEINLYIDITTPCGTSGTYIPWLGYTDDAVARAGSSATTFFGDGFGTGFTTATGTLTTTSSNNFASATYVVHTTGAATSSLGSINFGTNATACGSAGPMVGIMYITVNRLQ